MTLETSWSRHFDQRSERSGVKVSHAGASVSARPIRPFGRVREN